MALELDFRSSETRPCLFFELPLLRFLVIDDIVGLKEKSPPTTLLAKRLSCISMTLRQCGFARFLVVIRIDDQQLIPRLESGAPHLCPPHLAP